MAPIWFLYIKPDIGIILYTIYNIDTYRLIALSHTSTPCLYCIDTAAIIAYKAAKPHLLYSHLFYSILLIHIPKYLTLNYSWL